MDPKIMLGFYIATLVFIFLMTFLYCMRFEYVKRSDWEKLKEDYDRLVKWKKTLKRIAER